MIVSVYVGTGNTSDFVFKKHSKRNLLYLKGEVVSIFFEKEDFLFYIDLLKMFNRLVEECLILVTARECA